jgi:hypothetical protein
VRPASTQALAPATGYAALSMRPLTILVFLLPLMILYELGTILFLTSQSHVEVIRARALLNTIFHAAGPWSFHLPPLLLTVILLAWHALDKQRAKLQGKVLLGMTAESFLWTMPMVVLGVIAGTAPLLQTAGLSAGVAPDASLAALGWPARLTLAIGAGLYEELLFRLLLITLVHAVLAEGFKVSEGAASVVAVVVSAIAFMLYHNVSLPGGGADWRLLLVYSVGGLYLGALYLIRGFGIAVAVHALYDVFALALLPSAR